MKRNSTPISVQKQEPYEVEVATPIALFTVVRASPAVYNPHAIPWNYELNIPGKAKIVETDVAKRVTRLGRIYSPENLFQGSSSKGKQPAIGVEEDGIWKKVQAKEYSALFSKTSAQISILTLLKTSENHQKALTRVLTFKRSLCANYYNRWGDGPHGTASI